MCPLGLPGCAPAGMLQENCSETFSVSPQHAWNLDHLHSVTFPATALYLSNRAMWLSLYTAALHLCVCHTCPHLCVCHTRPHLLCTSWPCGPLVNSDVLFFITPVQPANTLGFSQSSSTFGKPQLPAKPFLHLLTQRRISYLPSQKEE